MIVRSYVSNLPSVGIQEQTKQNKKAKSKQTIFLPHLIQISIEIKMALGQEINGERPLQNLDVSLCSSQ